jgi:LruC domain-containing protein/uncharacterized repeat protein (TIGR01451 family)
MRKFKIKILSVLSFIVLLATQSFGQSFILDIQGETMSYTNAQRTLIVNTGNGGTNVGSIHKYSNVITKDGLIVYALLTITQKNNATVTNFDDDAITGESTRFQPRIGTGSGGGYIVYELEFFNTADNASVFVYNYNLTGIDIDGNSNSNKEYVEVGGYTSYTVNSPTGLTISTNNSTGRTQFKGINYSLDGVTFDNSAAFIANFLNANNKISFALGQTASNAERFYSVQIGVSGGVFSNPVVVTNPLPVAVDDVGTSLNSATGGITVSNVLENDLYDGSPVIPSQVNISLITPASNPGVSLNTNTGRVSVAPGTPGGTYTLVYQICMVAFPSSCDQATVTVKVLQADLSIVKTATPNTVTAGQEITYNIIVTNNGPTEALDVAVQDILPVSLNPGMITTSVGSWAAPTWTIGELASGASATMSIPATVALNFSGNLINTANVSSTTSDPQSNNNISTATVAVIAPLGPTATNDAATTNLNTPVDINVLANDIANGAAINPTSVLLIVGTTPNPATQGTFIVNASTGLVTFTPVNGFVGTVTVDYRVCDLNALCDVATITVVVNTVTGPTANSDSQTTLINTPVDINILANDVAGAGVIQPGSVAFIAGTEPDAMSQGTFTVNATTGIVTFTPVNGFIGNVSIDYQVCDLNNLCDMATITVNVIVGLNNFYPATGFGTLGFEDLWPGKGDYDFNDLVIDYKFEIITNTSNYVQQVIGTFVIKAFGASYENGFGFQLTDAIDPEDVTVTGYDLTENFITLNVNGTEADQSKPTIIVYDNAFSQMHHPGIGIGVNTELEAPYVAPVTLTISIAFKPNTYSYNDLDISNFNPFIIVNKVRGVEVHLPNYQPTDLADQSLLGTIEDNSDPSTGKYYLTANNLPWAINIYETFEYPIEKQDITWAHLKFSQWAVSLGDLFPDWYKNLNGYRNASLIYQSPISK